MTREDDIKYLSRRIEEEREKAEHASDPASYRIHTEFAREYERRLQPLLAAMPVARAMNGQVTSARER